MSICGGMHESIVFVVRVRCRRTESSRSLSHLLMSCLYNMWSLANRYHSIQLPITMTIFSRSYKLINVLSTCSMAMLAVLFVGDFTAPRMSCVDTDEEQHVVADVPVSRASHTR